MMMMNHYTSNDDDDDKQWLAQHVESREILLCLISQKTAGTLYSVMMIIDDYDDMMKCSVILWCLRLM